jgi:hypothetical protein
MEIMKLISNLYIRVKKSGYCMLAVILSAAVIAACGSNRAEEDSLMKAKVAEFATVKLSYDPSRLTENEKQIIPILIEVAQIIDGLFWQQTFGDKQTFLDGIQSASTKEFAMINYGPWELLNGNSPFVAGFGEKPPGANYYPADMSKDEFENLADTSKTSLYTLLRRDAAGKLKVVWYHDAYKGQLQKAAELIKKAAGLAEDAGFKKYLEMRAEALLTSDYRPSDFAWMEMKTNSIDFVVGPIESYGDGLYGYKTAFEAYVLIKDSEWSKKLVKYIELLPMLQQGLPVEAEYKSETPGLSSELGVYDAVYYAGDSNAGSKTIAINLPNDEEVQLKAGSRSLMLKNTMQVKFDNILLPIAKKLMDPSQVRYVKFDAFFNNTMFHEVAHGLGIKNTISGTGTVNESLKEAASTFEEAKADILGLFMATKLIEKGEIEGITAEDCFVTYMASIFRSVRFGAASSHGKANMMCFNFFLQAGAFSRNADGSYKVDFAKTKEAMNAWAAAILILQGNGEYYGAKNYLAANATINTELQLELDRLNSAHIPLDIVFEQGS